MTQKQLANEINNWFKLKCANNSPNFWNHNPVAKALKINLKQIEHWKDLQRGDPAKGNRKAKYNKAVDNGYDGEFS